MASPATIPLLLRDFSDFYNRLQIQKVVFYVRPIAKSANVLVIHAKQLYDQVMEKVMGLCALVLQ